MIYDLTTSCCDQLSSTVLILVIIVQNLCVLSHGPCKGLVKHLMLALFFLAPKAPMKTPDVHCPFSIAVNHVMLVVVPLLDCVVQLARCFHTNAMQIMHLHSQRCQLLAIRELLIEQLPRGSCNKTLHSFHHQEGAKQCWAWCSVLCGLSLGSPQTDSGCHL